MCSGGYHHTTSTSSHVSQREDDGPTDRPPRRSGGWGGGPGSSMRTARRAGRGRRARGGGGQSGRQGPGGTHSSALADAVPGGGGRLDHDTAHSQPIRSNIRPCSRTSNTQDIRESRRRPRHAGQRGASARQATPGAPPRCCCRCFPAARRTITSRAAVPAVRRSGIAPLSSPSPTAAPDEQVPPASRRTTAPARWARGNHDHGSAARRAGPLQHEQPAARCRGGRTASCRPPVRAADTHPPSADRQRVGHASGGAGTLRTGHGRCPDERPTIAPSVRQAIVGRPLADAQRLRATAAGGALPSSYTAGQLGDRGRPCCGRGNASARRRRPIRDAVEEPRRIRRRRRRRFSSTRHRTPAAARHPLHPQDSAGEVPSAFRAEHLVEDRVAGGRHAAATPAVRGAL